MPSPMAQASIDIQAPISLVYAILLHFAAYPDWNPFIVKVTNITPSPSISLHPITTDTEFTLHCKYSDGTTSTSRERVTEVTPPDGDVGAGRVRKALLAYRFAGALAAVGVVEGTRSQWMEQRGDAGGAGGVTRYWTEEVFEGVGVGLVPVAQVQEGFERMADALKARAESM